MSNGHLYPLVAMIALSYETVSDGSPYIYQSLISTGSPNVLIRLYSSLNGICLSITDFYHFSNKLFLNTPVNGPRYDIVAAAKNTSPTKFSIN